MPLSLPDGCRIDLDRPRIMGILNVTPDSFSDGGRYNDVEAAVARGLAMVAQGADILDVGGESTRPGSTPVDADEQVRRTVPVIRRLRAALDALSTAPAASPSTKRGAAISIDTSLAAVAAAALDAGADIINDVHAGRDTRNPSPTAVFELAARRAVPLVLMHMQGTPATMQQAPAYGDVVGEVESFLLERAAAAQAAGVARGQIVLDPGIGFGKTKAHNLALLANLGRLTASGFPVLLGASRKRFMGSICTPDAPVPGVQPPEPPAPHELVGATCTATALGVLAGVRLFRVHDVRANRQAADVTWAILSAGLSPSTGTSAGLP